MSKPFAANRYLSRGDHDRAIADYTEAIRLNPGNADFHANRGAALYGKGDLDQALADLNEARVFFRPTAGGVVLTVKFEEFALRTRH